VTLQSFGQKPDSAKQFILPDITVSATRNEITVFDVPRDVSVVSVSKLKQYSPLSANDIMKAIPEIALQRTTFGGGSPILRGMIGRENLILIDGIRVNNSTYRSGPSQYFNTIDAASIERVEVVYGPGSVLYGSDALGGVINIITKNPGSTNSSFSSSTMFSSSNNGIGQNLFAQTNWSSGGAMISTSFKKYNDLTAGKNIIQSPSGYSEIDGTAKLNFNTGTDSYLSVLLQSVNQNDVPRYDRIYAGKDLKNVYDPQQRHLFMQSSKKMKLVIF
ncbi:MAG: TonB-dependent receptor plug domain-containing protein, partial [Ignavibacteriaceae bacterium]|nr:TonB-dependent receptor plug domain-containing protein [Ignavibacteriaceae bacterium]